jgi:hypothetical protein
MRRLVLLAILATSPGCFFCGHVDSAFGHPSEVGPVAVESYRLSRTSSGAELEIVTAEADGTTHSSRFSFDTAAPLPATQVVAVYGRETAPANEQAALLYLRGFENAWSFELHLPPQGGWCEHRMVREPASYRSGHTFEGPELGGAFELTALALTGDAKEGYVPHLRGRVGEKEVALVVNPDALYGRNEIIPEEGALPASTAKVFVTTHRDCYGEGGLARRALADGALAAESALTLEDCLTGVLVRVEPARRIFLSVAPPCPMPGEKDVATFNPPKDAPVCRGTIPAPTSSHVGTRVAFCLLIVPAAIFDVATFPIQVVVALVTDGFRVNVVGFG